MGVDGVLTDNGDDSKRGDDDCNYDMILRLLLLVSIPIREGHVTPDVDASTVLDHCK